MNTVSIENLSKDYDNDVHALKDLTLALDEGEVFGYLGPNGAGKTTTVNLLAGVLTPTSGTCTILGANPTDEPEKAHAVSGIMTEHAQMYDYLTGLENLLFYGAAFGLEEKDVKQRAINLLNQLDLTFAQDRKLSTYSTGMRQRLSLARALIHRPKVLFLDEPTSGLDPENAQNVNQIIKDMAAKEGITVFLSTHQLHYAQGMCTRYGLLNQGTLLASGTLDELRNRVFPIKTLRVVASSIPSSITAEDKGNNQYEIKVDNADQIPVIVKEIVTSGANIYSVNLEEPTLEEIYFGLTSEEMEGDHE